MGAAMNHSRLEAAKRMQKAGWALTRYGQHIERCCRDPSPKHEKAAQAQLVKLQQAYDAFDFARREWRNEKQK
jgi:hypothetical protein